MCSPIRPAPSALRPNALAAICRHGSARVRRSARSAAGGRPTRAPARRTVQLMFGEPVKFGPVLHLSLARASRSTSAAGRPEPGAESQAASRRSASSAQRRSFSSSDRVSRLSRSLLANRARACGSSLRTCASMSSMLIRRILPPIGNADFVGLTPAVSSRGERTRADGLLHCEVGRADAESRDIRSSGQRHHSDRRVAMRRARSTLKTGAPSCLMSSCRLSTCPRFPRLDRRFLPTVSLRRSRSPGRTACSSLMCSSYPPRKAHSVSGVRKIV